MHLGTRIVELGAISRRVHPIHAGKELLIGDEPGTRLNPRADRELRVDRQPEADPEDVRGDRLARTRRHGGRTTVLALIRLRFDAEMEVHAVAARRVVKQFARIFVEQAS